MLTMTIFAVGQRGKPMNDTIYRQAAIDAICKVCQIVGDYHKCNGYSETSAWCDELVALRALPSATRRGRWIIDKEFSNIGRCSFCGDRWGSVDQMNYCPSCGAKMGER